MISNLPDISKAFGEEKTNEQILDSLQKYRKELNFLLMNLDESNMPGIASRLDGIDGSFSLIDQQIDSITLAVGNNSGDISSLQITAQGIQTQVSNNAGDISVITQTVNSIQSTVSSQDTLLGTHTSQITQLGNEISSVVSFTDVDGNMIASRINQTATTISLDASKIDLNGITTVNKYLRLGDTYEDKGSLEISQTASLRVVDGFNLEISALQSVEMHSATYFLADADFVSGTNVDFTGATVTGLDLQATYA